MDAGTVQQMMTNQTGGLAIVTSGPGWGFGFGGAVMLDPAAAGSPLPAERLDVGRGLRP